MEKFFADLGGAVMKEDTVKVEIMKAAYERAKLAAGCPTGDLLQMTEEQRMNYRPAPEFVWRAAAEVITERQGGASEWEKRVAEVLSPYLPK